MSINKLEKYIEDLKLVEYEDGSINDIHKKAVRRTLDIMIIMNKKELNPECVTKWVILRTAVLPK